MSQYKDLKNPYFIIPSRAEQQSFFKSNLKSDLYKYCFLLFNNLSGNENDVCEANALLIDKIHVFDEKLHQTFVLKFPLFQTLIINDKNASFEEISDNYFKSDRFQLSVQSSYKFIFFNEVSKFCSE
jgi:hypothetical protein